MEPECEPKLVALALQHLAQGWVATEENCDLGENMDSKCLYNHMLADNKRVSAFCVINFHIVVCLAQHSVQTGSHLADLLLSDLCKHLAKNVLKNFRKLNYADEPCSSLVCLHSSEISDQLPDLGFPMSKILI